MITCPWCQTSYTAFQSNCSNCGGPLPLLPVTAQPAAARFQAAGEEPLPAQPPPPPRQFSDDYVRKLLISDGWAVTAFVLALVGAIFFFIGIPLTFALVTSIVGLPFLVLGLALLAGGVSILAVRYEAAKQTLDTLRFGHAILGCVASVEKNYQVRINHRHPWVIHYHFDLNGQTYKNKVSTLADPSPHLRPGRPAMVLYLPSKPEANVLYPHP